MATDLERLVALMPPPHRAAEPPRVEHWDHVERHFGVRLPSDFKEFVTRYGSGAIDNFLGLLNPAAGRGLRMDRRADDMLAGLRLVRTVEELPNPVYPEAGGLLPWAETSNGDVLYWVVDPPDNPDRWPILIGEVRGPGWVTHPGPVSRFLVEILGRSFPIDFFPDDFPASGARFEPHRPPHEPIDPRSWDRQLPDPRDLAGPEAIRRNLDALLEEHRRVGSPLPRVLRPGLSEAEVRRHLESLGVRPHPVVMALYSWADGSAEQPAGSPSSWLVPKLRLMTLSEAVGLHQAVASVFATRGGVVSSNPWLAGRDWFPIMRSKTTIIAVIGSGEEAGELRAIFEHRAGRVDRPTIWTEIWTPYRTLADAIGDFADRFRAGLYLWDAAGETWEEDFEALDEYRHARF